MHGTAGNMIMSLMFLIPTAAAFRSLLGWVAGVSLIVGGIGIMNIMLVSVSERTREIGIRQVIGATPADIRMQFLTEALLMSIVGGLLAALAGVGGAGLFASLSDMRTVVVPTSILLVFSLAAAIGIFSDVTLPTKQPSWILLKRFDMNEKGKMKNLITVLLALLVATSLAGCSGSNKAENTTAIGISDEAVFNAETSGFELLLGSFELEETDLAIDSDQAKNLIPLWQAYASLSQSDITAQAELDAVLLHIRNSMTEEQLELIESWELSTQDMQSIMNENGLQFGRGNGDASGLTINPEDMPEGFEPGQGLGPGGGMGGGMGGGVPDTGAEPPAGVMPGDLTGTMDAETPATREADRSQRTESMNFLPSGLINALIEILQGK